MVSFPQVSPPEPCAPTLPSPIRATCPAYLILLDFTTRAIFGKEYRSLSSSLCNFLNSPVTLSLLLYLPYYNMTLHIRQPALTVFNLHENISTEHN